MRSSMYLKLLFYLESLARQYVRGYKENPDIQEKIGALVETLSWTAGGRTILLLSITAWTMIIYLLRCFPWILLYAVLVAGMLIGVVFGLRMLYTRLATKRGILFVKAG